MICEAFKHKLTLSNLVIQCAYEDYLVARSTRDGWVVDCDYSSQVSGDATRLVPSGHIVFQDVQSGLNVYCSQGYVPNGTFYQDRYSGTTEYQVHYCSFTSTLLTGTFPVNGNLISRIQSNYRTASSQYQITNVTLNDLGIVFTKFPVSKKIIRTLKEIDENLEEHVSRLEYVYLVICNTTYLLPVTADGTVEYQVTAHINSGGATDRYNGRLVYTLNMPVIYFETPSTDPFGNVGPDYYYTQE